MKSPISSQSARSGYLPTLDGWRAVAICGVLACHGLTTLFNGAGWFPNARLYAYAFHGAYGVSIFFAISGFLITSRLIEENKLFGHVSLRGFYIRRFFRILPASWCFLSVVLALQILGVIHVERASWFAALLFSKNFVSDKTHYLSHFWSLSVEEQFYLFWPLLFRAVAKHWGIAVCIALGAVALAIAPRMGFGGLFSGCALAFICSKETYRRVLARYVSLPVWFLCLAGVFLCVFDKLPGGQHLLVPLTAFMVVGTVVRPETFIGRGLEASWLRWLGRLSYSLYLWQELFCVIDSPKVFGLWQTFPLNIVCTFAVAIPCYYWVERPMMHVGHRLAPPATPGRGVVGTAPGRLPDVASPTKPG